MAAALESAWAQFAEQVKALPDRNVPYLSDYVPVAVLPFLVALNNVRSHPPARAVGVRRWWVARENNGRLTFRVPSFGTSLASLFRRPTSCAWRSRRTPTGPASSLPSWSLSPVRVRRAAGLRVPRGVAVREPQGDRHSPTFSRE